jgi:hypothetical protein
MKVSDKLRAQPLYPMGKSPLNPLENTVRKLRMRNRYMNSRNIKLEETL